MEPLLVRALRGEKTAEVPIWFMRQAGRYLPEYRELRAKHSMLDVIRQPELAAEVALQPLRRFPFDAAIIFADILNPLIGMGINLDFVRGAGPQIFNPLRNGADVDALKVPAPEDNVGYTLEAIAKVRQALRAEGKRRSGRSAKVVAAAPTSEGLLESLEAEEMQGCRVLIPGASATRDILGPELERRGALADVLPLYETIPLRLGAAALAQLRERAPAEIILTLFSPSAVEAAAANFADLLPRVKLASVGPITSRAIRDLGCEVFFEAEDPDAVQFAAALKARCF